MTNKTIDEIIEEIVEEFEKEHGFYTGLDNLKHAKDWLRTTLTERDAQIREQIREQMRQLVSVLYEELCDTQLATEEQWNEAVAPKLRALGNVIDGHDPDAPTARVYKFPHISVRS